MSPYLMSTLLFSQEYYTVDEEDTGIDKINMSGQFTGWGLEILF